MGIRAPAGGGGHAGRDGEGRGSLGIGRGVRGQGRGREGRSRGGRGRVDRGQGARAALQVVPEVGRGDGQGDSAAAEAQVPPRDQEVQVARAVPAVGDLGELISTHFPAGATESVAAEANVVAGNEIDQGGAGIEGGANTAGVLNGSDEIAEDPTDAEVPSDGVAIDRTTRIYKERWPSFVLHEFKKITSEIDAAVKYTGRGTRGKFEGQFPAKYSGLIKPSENPVLYFQSEPLLNMNHFLHPFYMVWYPEAVYPAAYPGGVPRCPFHKEATCVCRHGWCQVPRRGHTKFRVTAIIFRKYYCKKHAPNEQPSFTGIDRRVLDMMPDYFRGYYEKIGFVFSHRSALAKNLLTDMRFSLVQGLSLNGFRKSLIQQMKLYHHWTGVQWRAYIDMVLQNPAGNLMFRVPEIIATMRDWVDFDAVEYNQVIPSLSYLVARLVVYMESNEEYKRRRMQLIDGLHLSGDHSFKFTKCVGANRAKPFTAIYCILNELHQVGAFWFTTGTGMKELEASVKKIKQRYSLYGYEGPETVSTDRCCTERNFWKSALGLIDTYIATSANSDDLDDIEIVDPPFAAQVAYTGSAANDFVGFISDELNNAPVNLKVILVDGEWRRGVAKVDVLIIGTMACKVYLFQLSEICKRGREVPNALKQLLEDSMITKVGNRIYNDINKLNGNNVALRPVLELGHMAKDRGVTPTKGPGAAKIIDALYPGVCLPGKTGEEDSPRVSDWSTTPLRNDQIAYATSDGYWPVVAYLRMLQIVVPKDQIPLTQERVTDGLAVTLYSRGWKTRVVEGKARNASRLSVNVVIDLNEASRVYAPGALVDIVGQDGNIASTNSLHAMQKEFLQDKSGTSEVIIRWPLYYTRRTRILKPNEEVVSIRTRTVKTLAAEDPGELWEQTSAVVGEEEADDDADDEADGALNSHSGSECNSSDGSRDIVTRIPRNRRRRLLNLQKERVKNDIVHVFFRFQSKLSKEHGAYFSFITALRDAFFILNADDYERCLQVLRDKHKLSEREIANKLTYDFDWFLRRVQRSVPEPELLLERYMAVYNEYKDIRCSKTSKKLFEKKDATAVHKSTVKHIRRNCLSDTPLRAMYTPEREDRDGLTIYKCHRGTSANEGLHQKIRQTMRGFVTSPRLAYVLLTDFFHAWNQDIDVRIRGLENKYHGLYNGELVEEEIEKMAAWPNREQPPHPGWVSTKYVEDSKEVFGFIDRQTPLNPVDDEGFNVDPPGDPVVEDLGAEAADEMLDMETEVDRSDALLFKQKMPASSQWLANLRGRVRDTGRVKGEIEWERFKTELYKYQGTSADEADNYSGFQFGAFARDWNDWVDNLKSRRPEVTYKTSSYLQQAHKTLKRRGRETSTTRPCSEALRRLREEHRNMDTARELTPEFAHPESATVARPSMYASAAEAAASEAARQAEAAAEANCSARGVLTVEKGGDQEDPHDTRTAYQVEMAVGSGMRRKRRNQRRCRKCGRCWASDMWRQYHKKEKNEDWNEDHEGRVQNQFLPGLNQKIWQTCTVPEHLICVLFKDFEYWNEEKRMPWTKCKGCGACQNVAEILSQE